MCIDEKKSCLFTRRKEIIFQLWYIREMRVDTFFPTFLDGKLLEFTKESIS